jgi:uncharacterized protein
MGFHRLRRIVPSLFFSLLVLACTAAADDTAYRQSVEKWRADYLASLTSDSGWLSVSGLFWLKEGQNRFGSDRSNDMVLPSSAPAHVGTFEFHDGKTIVHIEPGVTVLLNGKPVQTAELRPDAREDRLILGDLTLYVHASGPRMSIRMKDKNSPLRKSFTGLHWFPIDESYRVTAQFTPYPQPKPVDSQNVLGDPIKLNIVGYLSFSLHGQSLRLEAEEEDGGLFIVFRDLTAGKETYPASRFVKTALPQTLNGSNVIELDFNKAYNPPCAYNPNTTCPLPVPGNRLQLAIPVGEKLYNHNHAN